MPRKSSPRLPSIFVASSTEALPVARAVKARFDKEADVDVWEEDIFKANRNYLDTLLNRASYYDFAIAICAADDLATIRKKAVKVTRDNVIFEFGLFLGRLGPNRTFLILEEGVEIFSDWSGISIVTFRSRENLDSAVGTACDRIREEMRVAERLQNFTVLPSTSLAIGYYNNFLKRVFEAFQSSDEYRVIEKDKDGNIVRETVHQVENRRPVLHVLLPRRLQDLDVDALKTRTAQYKQIVVKATGRDFPFYISGTTNGEKSISLFDIPTTMLSSKIAIDRIFSAEFLARENTASRLEEREIANFERTLRIMVPEKIAERYFKFSLLK